MSEFDNQYNSIIQNILDNGYWDKESKVRTVWADGTPAYTKSIFSQKMRFDNSELPILTTKNVAWKTAIKELLWIWQKQSIVVQDLRDEGVNIWNEWEDEKGTIGRSYGGQFESHLFRQDRKIVIVDQRHKEKHGELKPVVVSKIDETNKSCTDELIGKVFTSNKCGDAKVVDVMPTGEYYKKSVAVKLQFLDTGFTTVVQKGDLERGRFVDKYARTICDVGYLGNFKSVKNFSDEELNTLRDRWNQMINRCYNIKNKRYYDYGGKEVFVDERWHSFENFLRDIRTLPQFFLAKSRKFKNWSLDKDYYNSNCYSKDTCVWLSTSDNTRYTSKHKPFFVIKQDGGKELFIDLGDACIKFGFDKSNLSKALKNKRTLKGYKFEYVEDGRIYRYELSRNQVNELIGNIETNPTSRRLLTSFWNYADVNKKQLQECVWSTQWYIKDNKLSLEVRARSNDMALGNPFNVTQYNILQRMIAQVTGYELGEYIYNIGDCHVYERHIDGIAEQINRETFKAPEVWINPDVTNFYDFTIDDFKLVDYKHGDSISYEVAI